MINKAAVHRLWGCGGAPSRRRGARPNTAWARQGTARGREQFEQSGTVDQVDASSHQRQGCPDLQADLFTQQGPTQQDGQHR